MSRRVPGRARGGGVYVAVLGVALIISLIALASIHVARVETNVLTGAEQTASAQLLAQSAAEWAVVRLNANASWRSSYASGAENPSSGWVTLGAGRVKFAVVDADGNLGDNPADMVTIRGIGLHGKAAQVVSVDALPTASPMNCLNFALFAGGALTNQSAITGGHVVGSNASISNGSGSIDGDAWTTAASINGSVTGVKYASQAVRQMPETSPNSANVLAYYLTNGTRIHIDDIPNRRIEYRVVSPASSPIDGGPTNPQGIYVIDCAGQRLEVENVRIHATLVAINATNDVEIAGRINWNPPSANFPALIVQGDVEMEWDERYDLKEYTEVLGIPLTQSANYNPAGSPDDLGVEDGDFGDDYPGVINGLIYVSGNLEIDAHCEIDGIVIVGGTATISAPATLTQDPAAALTPPPGFATGSTLRIIPRTWRRSVR